MTKAELERVLAWTNEKLATGSEPPWAWFQYMKLQENLEAIISSMEASSPQTANSPQLGGRLERRLQLVDSTYSQDTALHHPSDDPVQMPM